MITQKFYKMMADLINDAQSQGGFALAYLQNMQTDLENSEILSTNIHRQCLDDNISATADVISDRHVTYTHFVFHSVAALQQYVVDNYGSVNDFIRDGGIQIKPIFAEISGILGYPIDADLIEADISNPSNIS